MQVHVDEDVCGGHGICLGIAPEVFELTDDGYAVTLVAEVPAGREEAVRQAVLQCPNQAITTT